MPHEEQPNLVEVIVVPPNDVNVSEVFNAVHVDEDAPTEVRVSMLGVQGPVGPTGSTGPTGPDGIIGPTGVAVGLPTGGSPFNVLQKRTGTDYDTEWTATPTLNSFRVSSADSFFQTALITAVTEDVDDMTLDMTVADSVKYMVRVSDGINAMTTEITATALGQVVNFTEYGTVVVGAAPCSFNVTRNAQHISLICTPATDTLTEYRVVKHAITG